jgi:DNA-directed RNA polymerase specialized sigma24 family protein
MTRENDDIQILESISKHKYTAQERSVFVDIDRNEEDKDVSKYQKTNDERLFEKIYKARIPTLQIWTRKYYYLLGNKEDMYGEFCACFSRAVQTYKKSRGAFNTWLFTVLLNCARNLQIGRRAKKRIPIGVDPNSIGNFILSLDFSYDGKDGTNNTLKDILAEKMAVEDDTISRIVADETSGIMASRNPIIKGFFKKLGDGYTIASLAKEYRTRSGQIKISKTQARRLSGKCKNKMIVTKLIRKKALIQDEFAVVDYSVAIPDSLCYTIEMKKTAEVDMVMRTIRRLRRDKKNVMSRI